MKTLVVIPMKELGQAKSRLSLALDAHQRERLVLGLFDRTLAFFHSTFPQFDVRILTASAELAVRTHAAGAQVLRENAATGLNAAASRAAQWAVTQDYQRLIIVPADIPVLLREEVEQMLALAGKYDVVIAEARDGGTNMLLMSPPRDIPFQYGLGSALRHETVARANGLSAKRRYLPFLGHDLDTPDDCLVLSQKNLWRQEDGALLPSLLFSGVTQ